MFRLLQLDDISPGMRVAKNIYDPKGSLLLSAGILIKSEYLNKLKKLGYNTIYVGEKPADIEISGTLSVSTRNYATNTIKKAIDSVKKNKKIDIKNIERAVEAILDEILAEKEIIINIIDISSADEYTFRHSVNVCVLSIMLARALLYPQDKLKELGMGALLHDIGKSLVPEKILLKKGPLTSKEFEIVKKHPRHGYNILAPFRKISLLSRHVAYQHHEREDGSGYPRALKDKDIIEYAKIVAITDAFDAITSDRPYREGLLPDEAIKELSGKKFADTYDNRLFRAFVRTIAPYPMGIKVTLSDGREGIVTKINSKDLYRPIITILNGSKRRKHKRIDLFEEDALHIVSSSIKN